MQHYSRKINDELRRSPLKNTLYYDVGDDAGDEV